MKNYKSISKKWIADKCIRIRDYTDDIEWLGINKYVYKLVKYIVIDIYGPPISTYPFWRSYKKRNDKRILILRCIIQKEVGS